MSLIGKRYRYKYGGHFIVKAEKTIDLQTMLTLENEDKESDIRIECYQSMAFEDLYKLVDSNDIELIEQTKKLYHIGTPETLELKVANQIGEIRNKVDELVDEMNKLLSLDIYGIKETMYNHIELARQHKERLYDSDSKLREKIDDYIKSKTNDSVYYHKKIHELEDEIEKLKKEIKNGK